MPPKQKKIVAPTIKLNEYARDSAIIYVEAVLEACEKAKVRDTLRAITDTDMFPRLLRVPEVEYSIGWLHGCAESHGVLVTQLWAHVIALIEQRDQAATATVTKLKRAWKVAS